jgi:anthranilate 1,2-dioxygenase small subunit/terephthalate 1,2-dioxygenase oxygenase component beta subunit
MKRDPQLLFQLGALNAEYARCLDNDDLEAWPGFFSDPCVYSITTHENYALKRPVGIIYADSQAMLEDRVMSLRQANIYERQRYRHLLGMPYVLSTGDGDIPVETPFAVYRIMRDGRTDLFVTGRYMDKVKPGPDSAWRFAERIVVCDSQVFDTLVAIPL